MGPNAVCPTLLIPTGLRLPAQGCTASGGLPWVRGTKIHQPQGGCIHGIIRRSPEHNPVGVGDVGWLSPGVAPFRRNPGLCCGIPLGFESGNLKEVISQSPGLLCGTQGYPGVIRREKSNPKGVVSLGPRSTPENPETAPHHHTDNIPLG